MSKYYTLEEFKQGKIEDENTLTRIFERANLLSKLSYFKTLDDVGGFTDEIIKEAKSGHVGEGYILAVYYSLRSGYIESSCNRFFELFQRSNKDFMEFLRLYVNNLRKQADETLMQSTLLEIAPDDVELKASIDNITRWYDIILENINRIINNGKNESVSYLVHNPLRLLEDLVRYVNRENRYTEHYTQQHGILFNHVDKYLKHKAKYVKIL